MRRTKAFKRGRAIAILGAAGLGYLIGSWNSGAVQSAESSGTATAAQAVARRFPADMSKAPVLLAAAVERPAAMAAVAASDSQLVLFDPEPMASPQAAAAPAGTQPAAERTATVQAQPTAEPPAGVEPAQPASFETADISPPAETADLVSVAPAERAPTAVARTSPMPKEPAMGNERAAAPKVAKRRGYFLDDAQIAAIKRRLQLTPDQETMWPAVAAALRNIGLERLREERRRGAAEAIDPNSAEVQDLKSAAIPMIMSFSEQQRDEVRNLAHGMGLDQLASEF